MEYIFWGYVACKALRDVCEYYVSKLGGKLLFYVDDNQMLHDGKKVLPTEAVFAHPNATIVIMCTGIASVVSYCRKRQIPNNILIAPMLGYRFLYDDYLPPERWLDYVSGWTYDNKDAIYSLYNCNDAYTMTLLNRIMLERTNLSWHDNMGLSGVPEYFNKTYLSSCELTFVDAGAYTGDSICTLYKQYDENLKRVYAIEPNPLNVAKGREVTDELGLTNKVSWTLGALGTKPGIQKFNMVGNEFTIDPHGDYNAEIYRLDDIVDGVEGTLCIKMDLEGAEIQALQGAERTIREYRPYMIICLYHHMKDLLDVPRLIKEICPEYDFYLRAGYHTECYAVPCK